LDIALSVRFDRCRKKQVWTKKKTSKCEDNL